MITIERQVDRRTHDGDLHPLGRAFERLRCTAVRLLDAHVRSDGRCASCGCGWPCRIVVLAENNLALVHDVAPVPVPPGGNVPGPAAVAGHRPVDPPAAPLPHGRPPTAHSTDMGKPFGPESCPDPPARRAV